MSKKKVSIQYQFINRIYHDVNTGAYAALGGPLFIKKLLGKAHYLVRASDAFYHEISPACFEATLANLKTSDTVPKRN